MYGYKDVFVKKIMRHNINEGEDTQIRITIDINALMLYISFLNSENNI